MIEFSNELECLIRARYTAVYITTFEEERALDVVTIVAQKIGKRVIKWTSTQGFILDSKPLDNKSIDFKTAISMAEEMAKEPTLFVWCDIHNYFKNQPAFVRCFKELCQKLRDGFPSNSIIISSIMEIPVELQKEINILELPLPDRDETRNIIEVFSKNYVGREGLKINLSPSSLDSLCRAGVGLSKQELENCLSKSLVKNRAIGEENFDLILQEKRQIIKKSGVLEYVPTEDFSLDKIGGLQNLKRWLEKRKYTFSVEAKNFGIEFPKGVLLIGVPGCGKSLSAKCIAATWKMPLLKLDMGRIFSGIVGSSEENMRMALNLCEAVSPAILWIDEIEKGLSGVGKGDSDGGTATRVFGNLLTWMQEKRSPVFVFATANQVNNLPPELLRKGRFDEIFFVDLPSAEERKDIFSIIIKTCGRNPSDFNLDKLVDLSGESTFGDGIRLTGSEIEAVVKTGILEVFFDKTKNNDSDRDVTTEDFISSMTKLVPIAKSHKESLKVLRDWANENAIRASIVQTELKGVKEEVSVGRNIDF
ncbi:AAA family ATPase [Clostridium estertheticum]|nr:AAA family ATPase [Clostridium estertheticum]WLC72552.1 AAA family ATPase [Clostridium estertheticum]